MAALAPQVASLSGQTVTMAAASGGGDTAPAARNRFLLITVGGTATTVTIDSIKACDQGFDHNLSTGSISNVTKALGPLDPARFADANGNVAITYSQVTGVTVACIEV